MFQRRRHGNGAASGLAARDPHTRVRQNRGPGSQARSRDCRAFDPLSWSLSQRRSPRLANSTTRGRLRGGPDHVQSAGHDSHLHLHAEMVRRKSDNGAVKRDCVASIGHDRRSPSSRRLADRFAPRRASTRGLSRSSATADRPAGLRDSPTQTARRIQTSAPRRSSAWRSRGNSHGRAGASPLAAGFLSLPAASRRGPPAQAHEPEVPVDPRGAKSTVRRETSYIAS